MTTEIKQLSMAEIAAMVEAARYYEGPRPPKTSPGCITFVSDHIELQAARYRRGLVKRKDIEADIRPQVLERAKQRKREAELMRQRWA